MNPGDSGESKIERSPALQQGAGKARKERRTNQRFRNRKLTDKKAGHKPAPLKDFSYGHEKEELIKMAIRNMRIEGDDILRKKSREVEKFDSRLWELLDDMADTLK